MICIKLKSFFNAKIDCTNTKNHQCLVLARQTLFCGCIRRINVVPKTGIVAINIDEVDALLYLNNNFIGKSTGETIYIPAISTNKNRFTIVKEGFDTIDKNIEFTNVDEDVILNFALVSQNEIGKVAITVPGGDNSIVTINGIQEPRTNLVIKPLELGTYSLKIENTNYNDYYGKFTLESTNTLAFTPSMIEIKPKTLAQEIFGNYGRNTKIFLGITIATSIFTLGSYIYANETLDATIVRYFDANVNNSNPPPIDLSAYTTANTVFWVGFGVSAALALTTGIYYMLWISEDDFPVENIAFSGGFGRAALEFTMKF